jgi:4-amino-4-deoxy-L-arabinose transferase-like glycosyltransferase
MAVMAGLLAALLVWTAVRRLGVPLGTAALATAVLACSPPLAVYGSQVYPELPAALAVLAAAAALTTATPPVLRGTTLAVPRRTGGPPWRGRWRPAGWWPPSSP